MNLRVPRFGKPRHRHEVEVRLDNLQQFFNSMDPSPFYEKDLDPEAEHYIVSWAQEFPLDEPVSLVLHVEVPDPATEAPRVEEAVHLHFRNQARLARLEFRQLMRVGSRSLAIGLTVLASCLLVSEMSVRYDGALAEVLRQGLLIGGWVAMWQPMQIYLYGWWPLLRRRRIYEKLGRMPVHIRPPHHPSAARPASSP
ncbi:MAG TPA: hypothetical protein VHP13_05665 [Gammaproteobacteria bacterium]|jgi:hypothetical protein|nr:hypothetical protein [Gammaproteobacteria bacterium]